MAKLCLGCMQPKECSPICEHCGYDERKENLMHQLPVGTILQNQYLIGRVLGQGGFGITYLGWDQHLSAPVAIKEYFPSGVVQRHTQMGSQVYLANGEAPELFQKYSTRFLKEARTLAQLTDIPEIVQIRNFFSQNDTAYIVMEYVQGITLKEHMKKLGHPLTEAEALAIMEPVLRALQKVHDHGLIHRDISPDNIMLPKDGGIKLIDFGTVRYVDDSGKSKSTEAVLKPGFAPIEQYNTHGNLGTWTDVYAICATFHYLLTGKVPADVHDRLDQGESLSILRSIAGISPKMVHALEAGMKVRIADRPQTIQELYQLLYTDSSAPQTITPTKPQKTKRKPGWLAAGCLAALVAVGAGIMLLKSKSPQVSIESPETIAAQLPAAKPSTQETADSQEAQYQKAWEFVNAKEYGKAAIAFAKLDGYQDSRELSFSAWKKIPTRKTISLDTWKTDSGDHLMFHALLEDGTVASDCLKSDSLTEQDYKAYGPAAYRDIVSIHESIGLRYDGTLALPGPDYPYYQELSAWTDLIAVSVPYDPYEEFFLGLKSDGTVVSVGSNLYGECDVSSWSDIVFIHAGEDCSFGVRSDGTAVATGRNRQGMCEVRDWTDIKAITSADVMTFGLKNDGTVTAVGSDYTGAITRAKKMKDVAIIEGHWSFTKDGTGLDKWSDIIEFTYHTHQTGQDIVGLQKDGDLVFGRGEDGSFAKARTWANIQFPTVSEAPITKPETRENAYAEAEQLLANGETAKAAILFGKLEEYEKAETLLANGDHAAAALMFGKLGTFAGARTRSLELWSQVAHRETISAGGLHSVGLRKDGTVLARGANTYGECVVKGWKGIIAVSAGESHTVGLKQDGTVVAVGNNKRGQCNVDSWTDIVAVSAGYWHTTGLKADGTVVTTHNGELIWTDIIDICTFGQLYDIGLKSDGTVVTNGNVDLSGWTDIIAISSGMGHIVGLKKDGTVVAAGYNPSGQCDVADWKNIIAVCASGGGENSTTGRTIGVHADGTIIAVGAAWFNTNHWNNSVAVSSNNEHVVALCSDGSVYTAGNTRYGKCDLDDWTDIRLPTSRISSAGT